MLPDFVRADSLLVLAQLVDIANLNFAKVLINNPLICEFCNGKYQIFTDLGGYNVFIYYQGPFNLNCSDLMSIIRSSFENMAQFICTEPGYLLGIKVPIKNLSNHPHKDNIILSLSSLSTIIQTYLIREKLHFLTFTTAKQFASRTLVLDKFSHATLSAPQQRLLLSYTLISSAQRMPVRELTKAAITLGTFNQASDIRSMNIAMGKVALSLGALATTLPKTLNLMTKNNSCHRPFFNAYVLMDLTMPYATEIEQKLFCTMINYDRYFKYKLYNVQTHVRRIMKNLSRDLLLKSILCQTCAPIAKPVGTL